MADLPKNYEPKDIEPRWYAEWMARGYFHADAAAPKAPFAIVIPPPNVTGSLHMGHALGTTIEDIFTRWHRMAAYNAMWLPGSTTPASRPRWSSSASCARRRGRAVTTSGARSSSSASGTGAAERRAHLRAAQAARLLARLGARDLHDGPAATRRR